MSEPSIGQFEESDSDITWLSLVSYLVTLETTVYGGGYIVGRDNFKVDLHEGNELEPSKMHFMYDRAYGDIVYGQIKGLTPYYKMLNTLFRFTLTPRGGDSDKISSRAKNLLAQMAPDHPKFAVI
jgi:hypothetical protein